MSSHYQMMDRYPKYGTSRSVVTLILVGWFYNNKGLYEILKFKVWGPNERMSARLGETSEREKKIDYNRNERQKEKSPASESCRGPSNENTSRLF